MKKLLSIITIIISLTTPTQAFMSINESAEILPDNYFNIGIAPQTYLSNGGGFDMSVFTDAHLFDNTDGRLTIGTGSGDAGTDFWTQASIKWVPFPDVDDQPAMGLRGALAYVRNEDLNALHLQITPLFSKKSTTSSHDMLPYAGLPITFISETNPSNSYVASQLTLGALWFPWNTAHIGAEFNLNLKNSVSSASVFFMFPFEGATGYKKY